MGGLTHGTGWIWLTPEMSSDRLQLLDSTQIHDWKTKVALRCYCVFMDWFHSRFLSCIRIFRKSERVVVFGCRVIAVVNVIQVHLLHFLSSFVLLRLWKWYFKFTVDRHINMKRYFSNCSAMEGDSSLLPVYRQNDVALAKFQTRQSLQWIFKMCPNQLIPFSKT